LSSFGVVTPIAGGQQWDKVGRCTTTQPNAALEIALNYLEDSSSVQKTNFLAASGQFTSLIIAVSLLQDEGVHQSNQAVSSSFFGFTLTIGGVCRTFLPEYRHGGR
jgi:hypothetical protein